MGDSISLGFFVYIGYAFLMTPFFFFGSYFAVGSLEKKGVRQFILERAKRLIIPFLLFFPGVLILRYIEGISDFSGFFSWETIEDFRFFLENLSWMEIFTKPLYLWFLPFLFVLSFFHSGGYFLSLKSKNITKLFSYFSSCKISGPGYFLFLFLFIGGVSFLIKTLVFDTSVLENYRFEYAPIYIFFYLSGIFFAKNKESFLKISLSQGYRFLAFGSIAAGVSLILFHPIFGYFGNDFFRGVTLENLLFSFLQSAVAVGFFVGFLTIFRKKWEITTPFLSFLSEHNYALYLVHFPLVIFWSKYIGSFWQTSFFLKFFVFSLVWYGLSILSAWIIRKIPGGKTLF